MNVLYITIDALRADHVQEDSMPSMRSFADGAIEFTECVANGPGTPWSFPALLASRYAGSTDGFGIPEPGDAHPTLAEVLSEAGMATSGFTDNRFASSSYNYDRGMDEMHDKGATSPLKGAKQFLREKLDHDGVVFQSLLRGYHLLDNVFVTASDRDSRFVRAEVFVDELIEWTEEQNKDWFAWLHPMDVHAPYEAPPEYQRKYLDEPVSRVKSQKLARTAVHHPDELSDEEWSLQQDLYKAECRYLDDQLSRLMDTLEHRGELDDTVVVLTADHGDMHGEHQRGGHPQEFWEEVIRVPLALRLPESNPATINGQAALIDVPPTILDALNLKIPSSWDGQSLLSRINGDSTARKHAFVDVGATLNRQHAALRRSDGWKLLRHEKKEYLFNLSENPNEDEEKNKAQSATKEYDDLSATLDKHLDNMERRRELGEAGIEDEEMIEDHLKELGYLE
ncbi:Arylsulfatase A [Halogranum gelatinilyticum]|uniref:Arylsulfatase A n=1 Tax=Halogranum gelatinilyticum TaxID=660521 RepID=A0A1G9X5P0_9EURY|nr:sulfatase-like hydrolase/transferase [Halogranum gelatinilyticum]SDM92074.1 Arylsulfatase A [Halogranum gelatinilyticum]